MQVPLKGEKMHVKGALCRICQLLFVNTPFKGAVSEKHNLRVHFFSLRLSNTDASGRRTRVYIGVTYCHGDRKFSS